MFFKKNIFMYGLLICMTGLVGGCSDTSNSISSNKGTDEPASVATHSEKSNGHHYHSKNAYQVNVVYFVPNDLEPKSNWRGRISGFMIYYQNYYRKWMKHWGFGGNTSFGLFIDNKRNKGIVKITKIEGKHPASYYPNHNNTDALGGRRIRSEVKQYFASHPDAKVNSKSWIIYIPRPTPRPAQGLPYYGLGRWAFVEDHGQDPQNAAHIGGGDAHELGHALGLQHNAEPLPQRETLGNALMHNGNHVWNEKRQSFHQNGKGAAHTSLTRADAAILNVSQTFSKKQGSFYGNTDDRLEKASGKHQGGNIIVSGRYSTNIPVTDAIVLLDPPGQEGYNRMGFASTLDGSGGFHSEISKNRLILNKNQHYGLSLWLIHKNGTRTFVNLPNFAFKDGVPEVDFDLGAVSTISKSAWRVTDFSDEAKVTNKYARNIIDGDFKTWWHNDFTNGGVPQPHYLTVDMGEENDVEGFQFVQVPDSHKDSRIKKLVIKVSNDGSTWQKLGTYQLLDTKLPQQIQLNTAQQFRYFKLITKSSYGSFSKAASLAEVGVY